jgi:UDP-N-acetylmuramoyl-tripeptide--D-alanyl-D-alanine ligase
LKNLNLSDIVTQIDGRVIHGNGDPIIKHVMKKSKKQIDHHTLVFHLDKQSINGKYWINNHSVAIVTDHPEKCLDLGDNVILIQVDHLWNAYWKFVDYYRGLFDIPVIGITGTCGKTTTKEMVKHILSKDFKVHATWKNVNSMSENLRYLLGIDERTQAAIFEMPVASRDYITVACWYFKPGIRVLLNIGVYHLTDVDTPEDYFKAKAKIVEGLDPVSGILILNADDEKIKQIDVSHIQNVIYFGFSDLSHFQAKNISYGNECMNFNLRHRGQSYDVSVPGYGEHNVYNALAAIAAATSAGADIETAIQRLSSFQQVEEHLEFKTGVNGCTVIDDTWNSSPPSMSSALEVLKNVSGGKRKIALLGYMPRLGEGVYADQEYAKMGEKAFDTDVDLLVVVGKEAREIGNKALQLGMDPDKVHFCETSDEIYNIILPYLNQESIVLIKITYRVMVTPSFVQFKNQLIV